MEEGKDNRREKKAERRLSRSFMTGAIALVFLIIGFQAALFVHRAAVLHILAKRDAPDTVYVYVESPEGTSAAPGGVPDRKDRPARREGERTRTVRKNADHAAGVRSVRETFRKTETFRFDPNTVSAEDLQRLGFSERQAQSILHYREKGGRFRRPSDFARSYVVADSVYRRLEPYIDIPKIDLNRADSAAFETLPGIGKWFAARLVSYRGELGGYSYAEQMMDLPHFDREKFDGLRDLVTVGPSEPYPLWTLPETELAKHPYIGKRAARAIVLYRDNNPREALTVAGLEKAGILPAEHAGKLARCRIAAPDTTVSPGRP